MRCNQCGHKNPPNAIFCAECGGKLMDRSSDTNENVSMTKGCKIWLWITLIGNLLTLLGDISILIVNIVNKFLNMNVTLVSPIYGVYVIVVECIVIWGTELLLFKQKKNGFYVVLAVAFVVLVVNIVSGMNVFFAMIGIINPIITYYFISKNRDVIR